MSIMVWGHRGHRQHRFPDAFPAGQAHENSLRAYEETLAGCMGLETDIIQSKEGMIFLTHDTLFDGIVHYELKIHLDEQSRELVGNRYIYQLSDQEAQTLRLKDGQLLPQLRHLLAAMRKYPGRVLNLELKGPNTVDVAIRMVERAIQENVLKPQQVVFTSFNLPALRDLRTKAGYRFKIGPAFALENLPISPMYPSWPNAPQDASYIPFKMADGVLDREDVRQIDPDYFSVERSSVTEETIAAISEKYPKAKFIVWTAAEQHPDQNPILLDTIERFAPTKKIYAVMSDFPALIQERLVARGVKVTLPSV